MSETVLKKLLKCIEKKLPQNVWQFCYQFIKFGIVGLSNTAVSMGVYYLFIWIDHTLYMWGNVVGFVLSVLNAFYWGNRFVFCLKDNNPKSLLKRLGKSYLGYGATFLLFTGLLILQVRVLGISEWLAPLLNIFVTVPLNFVIHKVWTFKKEDETK